ncbi:MAG: thiamine pyrophosphate-dependent enzyme, partial [Rhodospirillaceae bacterium]
ELAARGIPRMCGIPGGGSSLDLIDAAARAGIDFVLCRTETAAAIMAAVTGEITGVPGVVLTGIGPGAASAVNGIAYASLERAPLLLVTDTHEDGAHEDGAHEDGAHGDGAHGDGAHGCPAVAPPHQIFDQRALFAPVTKAQVRLAPDSGAAEIARLLDLAVAAPQGPVHVDLSAKDAAAPARPAGPAAAAPAMPPRDPNAPARAAALLAASRRPVLIAGLEIRDAAGMAALRSLAERLGAPAMTTYKAKGTIADDHPLYAGLFTNAKLDYAVLDGADLAILYGVDPVEMIPGPWRSNAATIVLGRAPGLAFPFTPDAEIVGAPDAAAAALMDAALPPDRKAGRNTDWKAGEIAALRRRLRDAVAMPAVRGDGGRTADAVVDAVFAAAPGDSRVAVDAGAHMFSAMTRWPARAPHDVLKSNGLSTMGFAVPAALAAWLVAPERTAVALTGDGGMMMCLGELSTAARLGARLRVVVLNDAALSLIDIKQQRQQRPPLGVRYPAADFAGAARAMGCAAWSVGPGASLDAALAEAFAADGPALVDVTVDPSGYRDQLIALRG